MLNNTINIGVEIKKYHKGADNAITYKDLAAKLNINEREVRDIVSTLVTLYQAPIGSSQQGYFYISNDEEFRLAHSELISRIKALAKRAKALRLGYARSKQEYKPRQMELLV